MRVFMKIFDKLLNIGVKDYFDINRVRLYRQVNGLNLFFTFIALSVGILSFSLMSSARGTAYLGVIQIIATIFYFSNLFLAKYGKINLARKLTLNVFEWHLYGVVFLTNAWYSPVLLVFVLFPLLAALVEESIFFHFFIGIIQLIIIVCINRFFPGIEKRLLLFCNINESISFILRVMALFYFPLMAAVIIKIIFSENLRAREKQKEMLNEIRIKNKQLENYTDRLRDESQRLLAEVNISRKIQTMVLPSEDELAMINDLDIVCFMKTADEVGGDYYDIINGDEYVTIGIGDVTGHGLPSGIIMMMAQTAIKSLSEANIKPDDFLMILNSVLYKNIARIKETKNMTLSLIFYKDGKCIITGQHESVLILRSTGEIEEINTMELGFYIGMLPDLSAQINYREFNLNKDDLLFLYTDGVTEATNEQNEQFGIERIKAVLKKHYSHTVSLDKLKFRVIKELYNFMGESRIYDDISMVFIKKKE